MNSMFSLIDLLVAGCGVYVIYLCVEMQKTRKIRESMLLPKGLDVKKCKDVEEYIRLIGPKQLVLGILALGCGVAGLLQDYAGVINYYVYLAILLIFFIYAVWYTVFMKKAIKKLW